MSRKIAEATFSTVVVPFEAAKGMSYKGVADEETARKCWDAVEANMPAEQRDMTRRMLAVGVEATSGDAAKRGRLQ